MWSPILWELMGVDDLIFLRVEAGNPINFEGKDPNRVLFPELIRIQVIARIASLHGPFISC